MSLIDLLRTVVIAVLFLSTLCSASDSNFQRKSTVIIRGATVIDVHSGEKKSADIFIQDKNIIAVQPHSDDIFAENNFPEGTVTIDATGKYAIPGLWDMHVHLTFKPELENRIAALFIANGVTSVRDMGARMQDILAFRKRANQPGAVAPRIWIAGPLLDGSPPVFDGSPETHHPAISTAVDTPQQAVQQVDELARQGVDLIKTYTLLRPDVFAALVKRAHHYRLPVAGHVPLRMTTPEALQAGMDGIEHLNGMDFDCTENPETLRAERVAILDAHAGHESGYSLVGKVFTEVGPRAQAQRDAERCDKLIEDFAERGTWHAPTMTASAFRALRFYKESQWFNAYRYLPAAVNADWRKMLKELTNPHKYQQLETRGEWTLNTVGKMYRAGIPLLAGSDTPSSPFTAPGFSLHDELSAMVRAGLPPLAALQTATMNPARFFRVEREQGSIEAGKVADLVLLDADPLADINNTRAINAVISRGRVYSRQELNALLGAMLEK